MDFVKLIAGKCEMRDQGLGVAIVQANCVFETLSPSTPDQDQSAVPLAAAQGGIVSARRRYTAALGLWAWAIVGRA